MQRQLYVGVTIMLLSLLLLPSGCGTLADPATATTPDLADSIRFYDWEEDMPRSVLDAFTAEYGVAVEYVTYESQEEALANIVAGHSYDVVVFDSDFIPPLINDGHLAPIDYRNVRNFDNISANFRDLIYDPRNCHSVPFNWGVTALVVRDDLVNDTIDGWADLWSPQFDGKIGVRDEPREPLGLALSALGYSINSEDPAEIARALEHLLVLKDRIILVDNYAEAAVPSLAEGRISALVGWAEDIFFAQDEEVPVRFVFPREGAMLWGDNFVIPANSPHKYTAEIFLDFLLRPDIAGTIVNENHYATANEGATIHVAPELRDNPVLFPTQENLKDAEVFLPLSPKAQKLYEEAWQEFKTALSR